MIVLTVDLSKEVHPNPGVIIVKVNSHLIPKVAKPTVVKAKLKRPNDGGSGGDGGLRGGRVISQIC